MHCSYSAAKPLRLEVCGNIEQSVVVFEEERAYQ